MLEFPHRSISRVSQSEESEDMAAPPSSVQKTEEEWRAVLSPEQFSPRNSSGFYARKELSNSSLFSFQPVPISNFGHHILYYDLFRPKFSGEYDKVFEEGVYKCAGCGTPLYKSTTKFDSGCGWPAFYEGLPGAINRSPDPDGRRTEITCAACGGHLGHVFKGEGHKVPTDERHCVNSVSIKLVP